MLAAGDPSTVLDGRAGRSASTTTGPSFDPATLGYSVTVSHGTLPGTYTNNAVHVTDDPFAQPVTVSASVAVTRVCTKTITAHPARGPDGLLGHDLPRPVPSWSAR